MESIFDGWEKKVDHILEDGRGGYCARGFIRRHFGLQVWEPRETNANVMEAELRIGSWILNNMAIPPAYRDVPGAAIAFANNEHLLDIPGFRMIDLLTRGYMPEEAPGEEPPPQEPEIPGDVPEIPVIIEVPDPPEPVAA